MSVTLVDPLSEVTRKERRMLLGLSMLGVFFTQGGALPTRITTLGVELNAGDQQAFLSILAVGLVYFLSAFFLYAVSDFIVWRRKITEEHLVEAKKSFDEYMFGEPQDQHQAELHSMEARIWRKYRLWAILTKPTSILRAGFEFILPLAVGIYSIVTVLEYAYPRT